MTVADLARAALFILSACPPAAVAQDYSDLVAAVGPSVVNIVAFRGESPSDDARPNPNTQSRGSGFVLDADGYVVTIAELLKDAKRIKVTPVGGSEVPAKIVGTDTFSGIALLKVEAAGLVPVKPADVSKIRAGQRLLLVGSAIAGISTVADGIVSHYGAPPGAHPNFVPYIAASIPLHPGNGGAPLFNVGGEVVGLVAQMYSNRRDAFSTLVFALPIDLTMKTAASLRAKGPEQSR